MPVNQNLQVTCKICNKQCNNISLHIKQHKINKKYYYDKYLIKNDTDGKCLYCGNQTNFKTLTEGYSLCCSVKCSKLYFKNDKSKVSEMLSKRVSTNIEKYGVEHPMQSEIGMNNFKEAIQEKYNTTHYQKTDEFKNKMKEHWANNNNVIKRNRTCKNTCLEKYGVENHAMLPEIIQKIKDTKVDKYGDVNYNNREKAICTCLDRYGVYSTSSLKHVQDKIQSARRNLYLDMLFNSDKLKRFCTPLFTKDEFVSVLHKHPFKCNKCNETFYSNLTYQKIPRCYKCYSASSISIKEIKFLTHLNISNRQITIENYKVDGLKGNKIFEFLGDFWHGNPNRFDPCKINKKNKTSFGELYNKTINKFSKLYDLNYEVYYMWEFDWDIWNKNKNNVFPLKLYKNNSLL